MKKATIKCMPLLALAAILISLSGCKGLSLSQLPFLDKTPSVEAARKSLANDAITLIDDSALREEGTLTVGILTDDAMAPLYLSSSDNRASGLDIDLAAALADEMGLKLKFVSVDSPDAAMDMVDIVLGADPDDVSDATVVGGYTQSGSAFFYVGSTQTIDVADLDGKTCGIQSGSVSETLLDATTLAMGRESFDNLNDAFEALESGSVDYVLCDAYAGAYLATGYDDIAFAGTIDSATPYGIAVDASNSELKDAIEDALKTVQDNGIYDLIRELWVGDMPTLTADVQISDIPLAKSSHELEDETQTDDETDTSNQDSSSDTTDTSDSEDGSDAGANAVTSVG